MPTHIPAWCRHLKPGGGIGLVLGFTGEQKPSPSFSQDRGCPAGTGRHPQTCARQWAPPGAPPPARRTPPPPAGHSLYHKQAATTPVSNEPRQRDKTLEDVRETHGPALKPAPPGKSDPGNDERPEERAPRETCRRARGRRPWSTRRGRGARETATPGAGPTPDPVSPHGRSPARPPVPGWPPVRRVPPPSQRSGPRRVPHRVTRSHLGPAHRSPGHAPAPATGPPGTRSRPAPRLAWGRRPAGGLPP